MNPAQRPATGRSLSRTAVLVRIALSILAVAAILVRTGGRQPGFCPHVVALAPEMAASGTLAGGEETCYELDLRSGELARIGIQQTGNGLKLVLTASWLRPLRILRCAEGTEQILSYVAEASGRYRLQLRSSLPPAFATKYSLRWLERRAAGPADRSRIRAETLCADAMQLQTAGQVKDTQRAIELYARAAESFSSLGATTEEVAARLSMGELYLRLGDMTNASAFYTGVLSSSDATGNAGLRVSALNGTAAVRLAAMQTDAALEYGRRALELAGKTGDRWGEAQALQVLGDAYGWKGDYQKSSDSYERALALRRELHDYRGQAQTILTLGYNAVDQGRLDEALGRYREAGSLFQALSDRRGEARVASAQTGLYTTTGRYWEAMDLYDSFREVFESLDEFLISTQININMGYVYSRMGLYDRALEQYRRALTRHEAAGHIGAANAHNLVGTTLVTLGDPEAAAEHHRRAIELFEKIDDRRARAVTLCYLGDALSADGRIGEAESLYDEALDIYSREHNLRGEANAYAALGYVHKQRGDLGSALGSFRKALGLYRKIEDRYREFQELYAIAEAERDLGNLPEARARIEKALAVVESLRTSIPGPDMRSFFFATTQQCHKLYIDILMQSRKGASSGDNSAEALHASEQARARSLLELLAEAGGDLREGVSPELLKREQELERTMNSKADRRITLSSGASAENEVRLLDEEIQKLDHAYDDLEAEIRMRSPRYASLKQPQPLILRQIQERLLDDDTLLLEYSLGEPRSYLWLAGSDGFHDYELPARTVIENLAGRCRKAMTARQTAVAGESAMQRNVRVQQSDRAYWSEAAALSEMLLGPAAAELGQKRLVIVPDGSLQYLSFGALPVPQTEVRSARRSGTREMRPLIADHEIVTLPSASTLEVLREQAGKRSAARRSVAVFADPKFEDPSVRTAELSVAAGAPARSDLQEGFALFPLPATRREADAIMDLVPKGEGLLATGYSATRELAMSPGMEGFRVIHFATHGFADDANPRMSGIALSTVDEEGRPKNGMLRLLDIYNLHLAADVVVLSACNTAMGRNMQGEGLIGLVRGFMYAGASRVVASLWRVGDQSTSELMKRFYRGMLKDGLSPAAALRSAQVAMWKHTRWSAPYHWAAFVLQGEYR